MACAWCRHLHRHWWRHAFRPCQRVVTCLRRTSSQRRISQVSDAIPEHQRLFRRRCAIRHYTEPWACRLSPFAAHRTRGAGNIERRVRRINATIFNIALEALKRLLKGTRARRFDWCPARIYTVTEPRRRLHLAVCRGCVLLAFESARLLWK